MVWLSRPIRPPERWRAGTEICEKQIRLGFGKRGGKWQLLLKFTTLHHGFFEGDTSSPYCDDGGKEFQPVLESTRELRIAAINHLVEFISDLKEDAENLATVVEKAAAVKI